MEKSAKPSIRGSQLHKSALRTLDELPGPRGVPLLGNALQLKPKELHRLIGSWADQFGPLFVFRVATTRILTVADAETIQQLLRDRPDRFRRWRKLEEIATDIKAEGLFTAEGAKWRRQRKFVMHALNASHVREFIPRLEEVVGRLRRRWWRAALSSTAFDAHADLMRLTVDVTSGLAFGKDLNTLEEKVEPIQKHLDKIFPAVARRVTALFPYWRYIPLPADREVADAVTEVGKFYRRVDRGDACAFGRSAGTAREAEKSTRGAGCRAGATGRGRASRRRDRGQCHDVASRWRGHYGQ